MKPYFRKLLCWPIGALLAAGVLLPTGCIDDASVCPPAGGEEREFHLRFDIVTRGGAQRQTGGSRALAVPGATQEGTADENYLDIPALRFLLFDADQKLLAIFFPEVTPEDSDEGLIYKRYTVNASVSHPYLTEAAETDTRTFYVMVLANYSQYSPQGERFTPGISIREMMDAASSLTFATPAGSPWWYPHIEDLTAGGVTPGSPQYIPMSGLQRFSVSIADFAGHDEANPLRLGDDINMLRAMAKIEVIDRINAVGTGTATVQPAEDERASIRKVELEGFYSRAALLPSYAQWTTGGYPETQYVSSATIPASAVYNEPYRFGLQDGAHGDAVRRFGEDEAATAAREDGCRVFSAYVPEYRIPADGKAPAWMQVTVHDPSNTGSDGNPPGELLYELKLASYAVDAAGNQTSSDIDIRRNNIYRYEILSLSANVSAQWTVCPMDVPRDPIVIPPFN